MRDEKVVKIRELWRGGDLSQSHFIYSILGTSQNVCEASGTFGKHVILA
jgi:hypothetical protein